MRTARVCTDLFVWLDLAWHGIVIRLRSLKKPFQIAIVVKYDETLHIFVEKKVQSFLVLHFNLVLPYEEEGEWNGDCQNRMCNHICNLLLLLLLFFSPSVSSVPNSVTSYFSDIINNRWFRNTGFIHLCPFGIFVVMFLRCARFMTCDLIGLWNVHHTSNSITGH